jgi:hypothetical protein
VSIGKGEPVGLGGKPNLRYAVHLAERGYVTLRPIIQASANISTISLGAIIKAAA